MLIVDASVLIKLFLADRDSDQAEALVQRHTLIAAPDIANFEIAQAITKRLRNREISEELGRKKLAEWERFSSHGFVKLAPTQPLIPGAIELSISLNYSLIDCIYLALANERKSLLVTADPRFVEAVGDTINNIRLLRDVPL